MKPMPCFPISGPRERDGLHERETAGIVVKTGWGAGLMIRRRYFPIIWRAGDKYSREVFEPAYWVWCETGRRWRLCEPAGRSVVHAGDVP